jgi:hypothetical protein
VNNIAGRARRQDSCRRCHSEEFRCRRDPGTVQRTGEAAGGFQRRLGPSSAGGFHRPARQCLARGCPRAGGAQKLTGSASEPQCAGGLRGRRVGAGLATRAEHSLRRRDESGQLRAQRSLQWLRAFVLLLARERGIWQRLRSAPLGKAQYLLARIISTALIGLFQFTLIYTAAIAIFKVRIGGSFIGFAVLAVALCVLNAAFGLMLAAIGRSAAATRGIAILATLLLVMVGGAWVPSFVFPKWLQQVSLALPTRWAVDGLDAMTWRGWAWMRRSRRYSCSARRQPSALRSRFGGFAGKTDWIVVCAGVRASHNNSSTVSRSASVSSKSNMARSSRMWASDRVPVSGTTPLCVR